MIPRSSLSPRRMQTRLKSDLGRPYEQNLLRSKSPLIWDLANDDNLREITVVIIKWAAGLVIILMRFLLRRQ